MDAVLFASGCVDGAQMTSGYRDGRPLRRTVQFAGLHLFGNRQIQQRWQPSVILPEVARVRRRRHVVHAAVAVAVCRSYRLV